mmetsp:Transcript_10919/g.36198  ORF Transcript_10919/g.36198 Transcript_10919/m.36198 type:complete len:287 (+) Transcript_10919:196-1056(+)
MRSCHISHLKARTFHATWLGITTTEAPAREQPLAPGTRHASYTAREPGVRCRNIRPTIGPNSVHHLTLPSGHRAPVVGTHLGTCASCCSHRHQPSKRILCLRGASSFTPVFIPSVSQPTVPPALSPTRHPPASPRPRPRGRIRGAGTARPGRNGRAAAARCRSHSTMPQLIQTPTRAGPLARTGGRIASRRGSEWRGRRHRWRARGAAPPPPAHEPTAAPAARPWPRQPPKPVAPRARRRPGPRQTPPRPPQPLQPARHAAGRRAPRRAPPPPRPMGRSPPPDPCR